MNYRVKPVGEADREAWKALFRAYLAFYETELSCEGIARVWNWIGDPASGFRGLLAVDTEGRAVALAHHQLMHLSLAGGMTCYLADLYVEPSERGKGVARMLIDHVRGVAKMEGLPSVDWLTQETNYAGRRLYDTYAQKTEFVFYSGPSMPPVP